MGEVLKIVRNHAATHLHLKGAHGGYYWVNGKSVR